MKPQRWTAATVAAALLWSIAATAGAQDKGAPAPVDELWEAVSWAQLGYHNKPVGILNALGFYDGLLAFNRHMAEVGFVRPAHQGIILADTELDPLLDRMRAHQPITPIVAMDPGTL
mgnify:CR=1 FL=1